MYILIAPATWICALAFLSRRDLCTLELLCRQTTALINGACRQRHFVYMLTITGRCGRIPYTGDEVEMRRGGALGPYTCPKLSTLPPSIAPHFIVRQIRVHGAVGQWAQRLLADSKRSFSDTYAYLFLNSWDDFTSDDSPASPTAADAALSYFGNMLESFSECYWLYLYNGGLKFHSQAELERYMEALAGWLKRPIVGNPHNSDRTDQGDKKSLIFSPDMPLRVVDTVIDVIRGAFMHDASLCEFKLGISGTMGECSVKWRTGFSLVHESSGMRLELTTAPCADHRYFDYTLTRFMGLVVEEDGSTDLCSEIGK